SLGDALEAADPGPYHHAGARPLLVAGRLPPRVVDRLGGGAHRVGDELVDLSLLLRLHPLVGIVGAARAVAARDLAGDLGGQIGHFEFLDLARAALAAKQTHPRLLDAAGERRDHAQSGDDDTSHARFLFKRTTRSVTCNGWREPCLAGWGRP